MAEEGYFQGPAVIEASKPHSSDDLQFRGYMPGLDLLRGMAISFVLIHHGVESRLPWSEMHGPLLMLVLLKSTGILSWRFVIAALLYIANMAKAERIQIRQAKPPYWKSARSMQSAMAR